MILVLGLHLGAEEKLRGVEETDTCCGQGDAREAGKGLCLYGHHC